jgi:starvation-inducible DNA-binding protein
MQQTKNNIPLKARIQVVSYLNTRLADCLDLGTQAKQAHWNVKGPSFHALHLLFDEVAEDIEAYSDLIAERLVQLGGTARGTAREVAASSSLAEYPHEITKGDEHLNALADALAAFGALVREGITDCSAFEDADSADIFTEISRGIDKWLWMVEAHLQPSEPQIQQEVTNAS